MDLKYMKAEYRNLINNYRELQEKITGIREEKKELREKIKAATAEKKRLKNENKEWIASKLYNQGYLKW